MIRLEELLQTLCPEGVEYRHMWELTTWDKKFNGVAKHKQPSVIKYHYYLASELKSLATEEGTVKLLFTSTTDLGVTTEEIVGRHLSEGEVVAIPWGGNPQVQYYKGKFVTSDNRIATSNDKYRLSNKFLYYWMLNNLPIIDSFYRGSGIKHPSMAKVLDFKVPVPPLPVQEEIVRILDTFNDVVAELETEQEARVKQYKHYRNELLSFDSKSKIIERLLYDLGTVSVEYKPLKDVSKIFIGTFVKKTEQNVSFQYPVYNGGIDPTGYYNESNSEKNSVVISARGANCGFVNYLTVDFWAGNSCYVLKNLIIGISSKFLYYYLKANQEVLFNLRQKSGIPAINSEPLGKFLIPIVPLFVQEEIVSILDRFETLVTDLKSGLPAEIALRRKQYEYYRDKLLTFEPKPPF